LTGAFFATTFLLNVLGDDAALPNENNGFFSTGVLTAAFFKGFFPSPDGFFLVATASAAGFLSKNPLSSVV